MTNYEITDTFVNVLGYQGRLLSQSKSGYSASYRNNLVFFNANIFDARAQKVWYGDVDLTADAKTLQSIADNLGEPFYVTRESPWRWNETTVNALEDEAKADEQSSVVKISPSV